MQRSSDFIQSMMRNLRRAQNHGVRKDLISLFKRTFSLLCEEWMRVGEKEVGKAEARIKKSDEGSDKV